MERCDSSEDEYEEIDEEMLDIECPFCESRRPSFEQIFAHIIEIHHIDFAAQCKSFNLDTLRFIKLINYIRSTNALPSKVEEILATKIFDSDCYLKPFLEDDHLLMFDLDDEDDDDKDDNRNPILVDQVNQHTLEFKNACDFKSYYKSFPKEKILEDYFELKLKYDAMQYHFKDMNEFIKKTVEDESTSESKPHQTKNKSNVVNLDDKSDSSYISSYSHFGIHHEMLSDKSRSLAYKDTILENSAFFKGKSVLDIGCGTGILSLFAAQAGADIVVAVDHSDIIYDTMDIIRQNGHDKVIHPVKGKLESIDFKSLKLPTEYDIIISEWMGYFLLFEGMIDTVLFARDHLMKGGGILMPNRSQIFLAAFSDADYYERNINFWKNVYGFNMSSFIDQVTSEATVDLMRAQNICSSSEVISKIDLSQCSLDSVLKVSSPFEMKFEANHLVHGFVGYFDCYFDLLDKAVILSTSPFTEPTHWKQTLFPLKTPLSVEAGQSLCGQIVITRDDKDARALIIKIIIEKHNLSLEYRIG